MSNSKIISSSVAPHPNYQQSKYGLLLERICPKPNHDRSKIMYLCLEETCKQDKFGCAHCFLNEHMDHSNKKILLEQFISQLQVKELNFLDTVQHFNKVADLFFVP